MTEEQEKSIESQQSVEISINAKMLYSGKVKVYAPTIDEAYNKSEEYSRKLEKLIREKNKL